MFQPPYALTEKRPKVSHESILLVLQRRELIWSRHIRCISGILFNICRGFVNSNAILSFFVTLFYQIRDSYVYIVMRCGYIYFIAKFFSFHHFVPDVDVSDYIMFFFSVTM